MDNSIWEEIVNVITEQDFMLRCQFIFKKSVTKSWMLDDFTFRRAIEVNLISGKTITVIEPSGFDVDNKRNTIEYLLEKENITDEIDEAQLFCVYYYFLYGG